MTTFFEKLREHELELGRLKEEDEEGSKKKSIVLKVDSKKLYANSNNENLDLLVKKFLKNVNINIGQQLTRIRKKSDQTSNNICY